MEQRSATDAFLQFTIGGCLFGCGVYLPLNQVMVHSAMAMPWPRLCGGWEGRAADDSPRDRSVPAPCRCLSRWARRLVWGSLAALFVGVLNRLRITFLPAILRQLHVCMVMIASGSGLMVRTLRDHSPRSPQSSLPAFGDRQRGAADPRRRLDALRRLLDDSKHQRGVS